ncbi:MAG TPA: BREX-3 system phosphatase PglZ, partial [Chloroflexota bacterium]
MPDWVERLTSHFPLDGSPLYVVSDPDGLLSASHLRSALLERGLEIVAYDDPVIFRYLFEAELRPRLQYGVARGIIVDVGSVPKQAVPYDILSEATFVQIGFGTLFPGLNGAALADLPRDDLGRVDTANARRNAPALGERATRNFLLRDVYAVPMADLTQRQGLVAYLLQRHYAREVLPESLDRFLVDEVGTQGQLGVDIFALLRQSKLFFHWLQEHWNDYVRAGGQRVLRESAVPFAAPPIRAYLDTLFREGQLERTRSVEGELPGWMRAGVLLPGDEPEQEFRSALLALDGAWPASSAPSREWLAFAWRWAGVRAALATLGADAHVHMADLRQVQGALEEAFRIWLAAHYRLLPTEAVTTTPVMVHHIAAVLHRALDRGERIALVVVDGLALDHWLAIRGEIMPPDCVVEEAACFAWAPTLTTISRQAIFAGRPPASFPDTWNTTDREALHWRRLGIDWGLQPAAVQFHRLLLATPTGADDLSGLPLVDDPRLRLLGLVLSDVDHLTHSAVLGLPEMQRNVQDWASRGRLRDLLAGLAERGFTVYLTADHGSVEAVGAGA